MLRLADRKNGVVKVVKEQALWEEQAMKFATLLCQTHIHVEELWTFFQLALTKVIMSRIPAALFL